MNDKGNRVIGVDIGKRFLDVAREGVRSVRRHSNDAVEIVRFVGGLEAERDIVIFERCGGYERALEAQLAAAGITVAEEISQIPEIMRSKMRERSAA